MSDRSIRDAVNQIAGNHLADKVYAVNAIVNSVDESARTCVCQVVSGKANNIIPDVRLMASADDGFLVIPTIDSNVCIIISDYTDPYITQYSGIDKIIFRGGDLGGIVKVDPLTTKLNNLENLVNDLVVKYNSHVHPVVATGSPSGPVSVQETTVLTLTDRTEIENKNITHG